MTTLRRFLISGCTILLCPLLLIADEPKRSLEEDVAHLVQNPAKNAKKWEGKSFKVEKAIKSGDHEFGKEVTVVFVFTTGESAINCIFPGKEEFLKKPGVKGNLCISFNTSKGGWDHYSYFRFEERNNKRYLVIPDWKGKEISYLYEIEGRTFKLKGGDADGFQNVDSAKLGGEYRQR
jgi:hypothetical protein